MSKKFTLQCMYHGYWSMVVTVEAGSPAQACAKAIEKAESGELGAWKSLDDVGDTYIGAVCEGETHDPWFAEQPVGIPAEYTEAAVVARAKGGGEPHVYTVMFTDENLRPEGNKPCVCASARQAVEFAFGERRDRNQDAERIRILETSGNLFARPDTTSTPFAIHRVPMHAS